jgi:OmpA-OmpF porin, OOP family
MFRGPVPPRALVAVLMLLAAPAVSGQTARPVAPGTVVATSLPPANQDFTPQRAAVAPGMVVVAGTVPDESARQLILSRMRDLYGADRVVDQLGVGNLVAPPQWAQHVQRMLSPELKQVSRGQIAINGNVVELKGEVASEAVRQQLVSALTTQINNPTYAVRNGLRVVGQGQEQIDAALANRIVEFEPGSAQLTPAGQEVLNQVLPVLRQLAGRRFEIIGHTDALGARSTNVALSQARADSVKAYLTAQGQPESSLSTSGVGPDRPVATNDTAEGRARNRRIEFRVGQ